MFLPKPNVLEMPACVAPIGIGLEACNSGNTGSVSGCDVNAPSSKDSGSGILDVIQTIASIFSAAATAAS